MEIKTTEDVVKPLGELSGSEQDNHAANPKGYDWSGIRNQRVAHPKRLVVMDEKLKDQAFEEELNSYRGKHTKVMLERIKHIQSLPLSDKRKRHGTDFPTIRWEEKKSFFKRWRIWLTARRRQFTRWLKSILPARRVVYVPHRPEANQSYYHIRDEQTVADRLAEWSIKEDQRKQAAKEASLKDRARVMKAAQLDAKRGIKK